MLRDEILTGGFNLQNRDDGAIAAALSVGRTKIVPTEIGKGRILATLGLATGNALLDVIDTAPDFRHVKQLVENGWLDIGSDLSRASLDALVPAVLTQVEADTLKALAEVPDPVTPQDVAKALEGV
jgi:hypothetical protein